MSDFMSGFKTFCQGFGFGKVFDSNKDNELDNCKNLKEKDMDANQNNEEIKNEQTAETAQNTEAQAEINTEDPQTVDAEAQDANAEAGEAAAEASGELSDEAKKIAELEEKVKTMQKDYLYLLAEFENYKKRALKEKSEAQRSAKESVLGNVIPLCDNLERAMKVVQTATEIAPVKEGIDLIYNMFVKFLADYDIKAIETEGQEFNTDFHEAVATIPAPSEDMKNKIIDCTQKGYIMGDKVVRFAKVVIGQ